MPAEPHYTMGITSFFTIMLSMVFVSNFVLSKFLGLCPFLGVTKRTDSAFGMGVAVIFVMTMASSVTWVLYRWVLLPASVSGFNVFSGIVGRETSLEPVLKTVSYILVIATLVQIVELAMKKTVPALYRALGIYLPLITTNCAVLGVALLNTTNAPANPATGGPEVLDFWAATLQGFFGGTGFLVVMLLMAGIRERIEMLPIPMAMRGMAIGFICTALMALAFTGFTGMAG